MDLITALNALGEDANDACDGVLNYGGCAVYAALVGDQLWQADSTAVKSAEDDELEDWTCGGRIIPAKLPVAYVKRTALKSGSSWNTAFNRRRYLRRLKKLVDTHLPLPTQLAQAA